MTRIGSHSCRADDAVQLSRMKVRPVAEPPEAGHRLAASLLADMPKDETVLRALGNA